MSTIALSQTYTVLFHNLLWYIYIFEKESNFFEYSLSSPSLFSNNIPRCLIMTYTCVYKYKNFAVEIKIDLDEYKVYFCLNASTIYSQYNYIEFESSNWYFYRITNESTKDFILNSGKGAIICWHNEWYVIFSGQCG